MSEENDDRKEKIKLDLADMLMKTIPSLPDNIHNMTAEEQENLLRRSIPGLREFLNWSEIVSAELLAQGELLESDVLSGSIPLN